jgi:tetratricopeptide (TPR) repeat protein
MAIRARTRERENVFSGNSGRASAARLKTLAAALLIAALIAAVFFPVAGFDFINYDDPAYVGASPHVTGGLTLGNVAWAFRDLSLLWIPLTKISLMADVSLFGVVPGRIHLVNVFYHAAAAILLLIALLRMTGARWPSALVAALFAIHPLHVQSVAWIAERKDVLSALLLFGCLSAYVAYARRPGVRRYLAVLLLCGLGLMAKPMLVSAPALLLALDFWPLGRLGDRRRIVSAVAEKVPLLLLGLAALLPTLLTPPDERFRLYPLAVRCVNSLVAYAYYVANMLWPADLSIIYPHPRTYFPLETVLPSLLLLVAVTAFAVRFARRQPALLAGWLWYLACLAPAAGLVQIGDHVVADRYSYLPLVGLFFAGVWGVRSLVRPRTGLEIAAGGAAGLLVLALALSAHREVLFWRDSLSIFGRATQVTAGNHIALEQLGMAYASQGRQAEAIGLFRESIAAFPYRASVYNGLGTALGISGHPGEAADAFRSAIRIDPALALARSNLGAALLQLGQVPEAIASLEAALRLDPLLPQAHFTLGCARARRGELSAALAQHETLRRLDGRLADALLEQIRSLAGSSSPPGQRP